MGYLKDTIHGASWVGALRISTRFIALVKIFILGRILLPEQFGLVAIATLVLALIEIFTETGINVFLLQEKDDIDDFINTAWVTSILRGFIIFIVILVSILFVPKFFNAPETVGLLVLVSFVPLIRGFINPSIIKLQKNLKFARDFWFRFVIFAFDALFTIVMAIITHNAASLIYGLIAGSIFEVILSFYFCKPIPRFIFEKNKCLEVLKRGKWITGAGILQYLFREGDDIVVGRLLGAGPLGLYQMAYKLATLPITEVADVFGKVTLPVFVRISEDKQRLKSAFIKTTLGIALITMPFGIILYFFSEQIIIILLGPEWRDAATALQFVAIYSVIRAIINPGLTVLLALKRQDAVTYITLLSTIGMALTIIPLVQNYGIAGAGMATVLASLVSIPLVIYYSVSILK